MSGHSHSHGKDLEKPLLADGHGHGHAHSEEKGHSHDGGDCCGGHDHGHKGHEGHGGHGGHGHDDHGHENAGHGHSHGGVQCHGHGHGGEEHGDDYADDQRRLKGAVYCALFFMTIEIIGGIYSNSLAILTDAAHMLSDVGGFIVSLVALQLAAQTATREYTYGFKQAEVLGALLSIMIVWALTAILLWEAVPRFFEPEEVDAPVMFYISVTGFIVNIILMQVLGHGHSHGHGDHGHSCGGDHDDESVAVKAAMAHVIGDMVQSLGVCLAALCMWLKPFDVGVTENGVSRWNYADPCCTLLFGVLVLWTTKSTLVFTVNQLMVKAPSHIDQDALVKVLYKIPHVDSIHDLHVWSHGTKEILITCHVMVHGRENCSDVLKACIRAAQQAGIGHSTFQVEIMGEFDPSLETGLHGPVPDSSQGSSPAQASKSAPHQGHGAGHGHSHDSGHSHGGGNAHSHV
eukprot:TRINITY_DN5026_c0_g1_i1.p1 TRINITY_DN5026_c0_g1~~TRINITY_DN5026_c0_g1_i1.p1  ORF type:complete len:459 (+),score=98.47 TRINITY_DN5026_c0_g1_i1:65-1441(+)